MIMNPPPGRVTDHIDGNGLNNSRANMGNGTPQWNHYNIRPTDKSSGFTGLCRRGDKWFAKIAYNRKSYFLGPFDTEVEAARSRDRKAIKLRGEFAWPNFPPAAGDRKSIETKNRSMAEPKFTFIGGRGLLQSRHHSNLTVAVIWRTGPECSRYPKVIGSVGSVSVWPY